MTTRRNVRYSPIPFDNDDGDVGRKYDPLVDYGPRNFHKVPWKSIALAIFLLLLGSLLLFLSFFILTAHMGGEKFQGYGLLVLGLLSFLPGFYVTRIAYYSWRGANGYCFSLIPDYRATFYLARCAYLTCDC